MSVGSQIRRIAAFDVPVEAMREMFIVLAEQLEQEESKRAVAAERQKRYRLRHNNGDNDATVTLQLRDGDVTVTQLAPVENNISKPSLLVEVSKKEEKGNLSVSQKAPSSKPLSPDPEGFAEFWAAYPKRAGNADRLAASKGFRAATKRIDPQTIIAGARAYAAHCDLTGKTGTEFVRQARTWLNAQGWTENYENNQCRPKLGSIAGSAAIIDAALAAEETAIREEEERQRFGEANVDELPRLRQVN